MENLLQIFNSQYDMFMDTIENIIEHDALVGIEAEETVEFLNNDYGKSPIFMMNQFLNSQGFRNSSVKANFSSIDSISIIDILVFHNHKCMDADTFRYFVNTGCQTGYLVKINRPGANNKFLQPVYLYQYGGGGPNLYGPNKDNAIIFDRYSAAYEIVKETDIPEMCKVSLIQLHDAPFNDREIKINHIKER